ncbi:MAG: hypothetical protein WC528_04060 [Patescibacteria group bacterium]
MLKTIAVHPSPDVDACICAWLATRFGRKHFPGIETAKVEAWPTGRPPEGMKPEDLAEVLAVDVGFGIYDHHNPELAEANKSSADLVAQAIGRIHDGSLANLLEFCRLQDGEARGYLTGGDRNARMISLVNTIKGWNLLYPDDPQKVVELAGLCLDGIYAMEKDEFQANCDYARAEFKVVRGAMRIGFVISSTNLISGVMRQGGPKKDQAERCQVVIVSHPETGHVRIEAHRDLDLAAVRLRLVILEAYYRKIELAGRWADLEQLATCRTVEPVPNIYFHAQNLILNGSLTHPEVEPMMIDRNRLLQITADALADRLPSDYPCAKDQSCARKRGCPFGPFNLRLCREYRQVRWEAYQRSLAEGKTGAEETEEVSEAENPQVVIHLDGRRGEKKAGEA